MPKHSLEPLFDLELPGINVQWPWSALLLSGEKTVETRSYALPKKFEGRPLALIETPGPRGKKEAGIAQARIIGVITFESCYRYISLAQWKQESDRHLVSIDDPKFRFLTGKPKWAWAVKQVQVLPTPCPAPKRRGIVFATQCRIKS